MFLAQTLLAGMLCLLESGCGSDSEIASAENAIVANELTSILNELHTTEAREQALQRALRILSTSAVASDDVWKPIVIKCSALIAENDAFVQQDAAEVLARTAPFFPELAEDVLDAELKALDNSTSKSKCALMVAISSMPIKSRTAVDRLRPEINVNQQLGLFYSIHAAAAIARISPELMERLEMINWLRSLRKHEKPYVRWMVADALGIIGAEAESSLSDLKMLLDDESSTVRATAARAIWRVSKENAAVSRTLVDVLLEEDGPYFTAPRTLSEYEGSSHALAMRALVECGECDERGFNALLTLLESPQLYERKGAVLALLRLPVAERISGEAEERIKRVIDGELNVGLRTKEEQLWRRPRPTERH